MIDALSEVIDYLGGEQAPCWSARSGHRAEDCCMRKLDDQIVYNAQLPSKVYGRMCDPCLAYWHAQMARNMLISVARTR